jgi:hypothetical protein
MATNETKWTPGPYSAPSPYGRVGFEIIAAGRSIAVVNGIAEKRRQYLEARKAAIARRDGPHAGETRETIEIESSESEALGTALLFASATDLYAALDFMARRCGHHLKPDEQQRVEAVLARARGEAA